MNRIFVWKNPMKSPKRGRMSLFLALLALLTLVATPGYGLEFLYRERNGLIQREFYRTFDGRILVAEHYGQTLLPDTPAYIWYYGCSPTSAGMMMGYYDYNCYGMKSYQDLVPGGPAPMTGTPDVEAVIASSEHISDYYVVYGATGDPNPGGHADNCLADFMGTSQDACGNTDGGTAFWFWEDCSRFTSADAVAVGVAGCDGTYGLGTYVEFAGYSHVTGSLYYQRIHEECPGGFTFDDYKSEINAGRPVMIHVLGHSMLGFGYSEGESRTVYLRDTWDESMHTMAWGGSYGGMDHVGVTCLEPAGGDESGLVTADFWADQTSGEVPLFVRFTDGSTGSPTYWEWDFEDDGIVDSGDQNPQKIYANTGIYPVELYAANYCTEDTYLRTGYITVNPCENLPVWNVSSDVRYNWIADAYEAAGNGDSIRIQALLFDEENLALDLNKTVTLKGGYNCDYNDRAMGTVLGRPMVISSGTIIVENIVL